MGSSVARSEPVKWTVALTGAVAGAVAVAVTGAVAGAVAVAVTGAVAVAVTGAVPAAHRYLTWRTVYGFVTPHSFSVRSSLLRGRPFSSSTKG